MTFFIEAMPQPWWTNVDEYPMTQKDGNAGEKTESPRNEKKPYGKPTFRYERVFETMALSCGKVSPVQFQCRFNRKNS